MDGGGDGGTVRRGLPAPCTPARVSDPGPGEAFFGKGFRSQPALMAEATSCCRLAARFYEV